MHSGLAVDIDSLVSQAGGGQEGTSGGEENGQEHADSLTHAGKRNIICQQCNSDYGCGREDEAGRGPRKGVPRGVAAEYHIHLLH